MDAREREEEARARAHAHSHALPRARTAPPPPPPTASSMLSSLSNRWRSNHGALQKSQAVTALQHLLGFSPSEFDVDLNVNSTMIFKDLARICVQELVEGDEIVVSTSNHCANYDCWIEVRISDGSERDEKRRTFYHERL